MRARAPSHYLITRPRTTLGNLSLVALLASAMLFAVFGSVIGLANGRELLLIAGVLLVTTLILATNRRWTPLLGTLVTGSLLVAIFFVIPEPRYDLTHPHQRLPDFVMNVLIVACLLIACGATLGALLEDKHVEQPHTPRWLPVALATVIGGVVGALLVGTTVQADIGSSAGALDPRAPVLLGQVAYNW